MEDKEKTIKKILNTHPLFTHPAQPEAVEFTREQSDFVMHFLAEAQDELEDGREVSELLIRLALSAFYMGCRYADSGRFEIPLHHPAYKVFLSDGSRISSTTFVRTFMARNQTTAYSRAENAVRRCFDDDDEIVYHLVRDRRRGINSVFKMIISEDEPQRFELKDFELCIACFCAGVMKRKGN
jgi:hypothetical protein